MSLLTRTTLLLCAVAVSGAVSAQTPSATTPVPTIKRTPLQTVDVPAGSYNAVTAVAELVPNASIGRHTHPGPETGYLIEGEMTLMIDGQPPRLVKAGESYQVPAGAVHDAKSGDKGVKVIGVYIVEKGKPLAMPAPQ